MKHVRSFVALFICSIALGTLSAGASASERSSGVTGAFWADVRELVLHCAVMPLKQQGNRKVAAPMVSHCRDLRLADGGAYFVLGNSRYFAFLVESPDSDGGDLFHLRVINERRRVVAARDNVPAFGDVLLGLAGSSDGIREVAR